MSDNPNCEVAELARHASSMGSMSRGTTKYTPTTEACSADGRQRGRDGTVLAIHNDAPNIPTTSTNGYAYDQDEKVHAFGSRLRRTRHTSRALHPRPNVRPRLHLILRTPRPRVRVSLTVSCVHERGASYARKPGPVCDWFKRARTSAELEQILEENYRGLKAAGCF